jgi:chromosome partitioning protein
MVVTASRSGRSSVDLGELVIGTRLDSHQLSQNGVATHTGHIFAIVNQKGGVGKSTTAINLGASLARLGKRVLLVDMDPQGNSTSGVGIDKSSVDVTAYDVVTGSRPAEGAILNTSTEGLDILPSDVRLAGAEVELVSQIARETKLRTALRSVEPRYDFLLIDCPPSLGLLTINGMTAAESCLIPLQCEFYALEGLAQLMDTIALIRRHINPALGVAGIVLTMVDQRTKLSEQVAADVRAHFPSLVLATEVPRSIRLAEAPSYGQPVASYAPGSKGAEAYVALARELLARLGMPVESEPAPDPLPQQEANAATDEPRHDEEAVPQLHDVRGDAG